MTPGARTQAAIELLDAITLAARDGGPAADTLVARYFAMRRYAGSKDRRAVRALVYDAVRALGERPANGREAMVAMARLRPELTGTFDGSAHGPAALGPKERAARPGLAPAWLVERLAASGLDGAEQAALLERAPLDLRVNRLKADPADVVAEFPGASTVAGAPDALRLPPDSSVERSAPMLDGRVEVQDAGSQIVATAAAAAPGMIVVDLCAGAGGKTLALAAAMANEGRLIAADTDRTRLSRLPERAARAGVTIVETRLLDPGREPAALADLLGAADVVLIDAPCSGTGTWRRNPEARWRLTPARLARLAATQRHLLDLGATLVKPGGALVYIVCSLLDEEGGDQAAAFLDRAAGWAAASPMTGTGSPRSAGLRLTPATDATDGFFVARLRRPC